MSEAAKSHRYYQEPEPMEGYTAIWVGAAQKIAEFRKDGCIPHVSSTLGDWSVFFL